MDYTSRLIKLFNGLKIQQTLFMCENKFSANEVGIFSLEDRKKIWEPDGFPFCGDFDLYVKLYKENIFKGFFRIEVFPWGEINLHIAFPTSRSMISRYYLKTTSDFLKILIPISREIPIYCVFKSDNNNVIKYMEYFNFDKYNLYDNIITYKFNLK